MLPSLSFIFCCAFVALGAFVEPSKLKVTLVGPTAGALIGTYLLPEFDLHFPIRGVISYVCTGQGTIKEWQYYYTMLCTPRDLLGYFSSPASRANY